MEPFGNLGEAPVGIMLFDIAQHREDGVLFPTLELQRVCVIEKLRKEQPHRALQNPPAIGDLLSQRINQVFDQILDRQDFRHMKQQISSLAFPGQAADDKAAQRRLLLSEKGQRAGKEGRAHDKIHCHVPLACRRNGLSGILSQHQQLPLLQNELDAVDNMPRLPGAHVYHLHIIMAVLGKRDKARVRPDGDDTPGGQQLVAGDHIPRSVHVKAAVDLLLSGEDSPLFITDRREFIQQRFMHARLPPTAKRDMICKPIILRFRPDGKSFHRVHSGGLAFEGVPSREEYGCASGGARNRTLRAGDAGSCLSV